MNKPAFDRCKAQATCLFLALLTPSLGLAGTVSPPYQVGTWQGFRQGAVSYTFDDDLPNQYSVAVPMFNAKGFKMTLFTVTTWLPGGDWTPVQTAASYGHEIASHTVTHTNLSSVSASVVTNELQASQSTINAHVTNQQCLTLAYPYCVAPANASITPTLLHSGPGLLGPVGALHAGGLHEHQLLCVRDPGLIAVHGHKGQSGCCRRGPFMVRVSHPRH